MPNREDLIEFARVRAAFCSLINVHFIILPDADFVERIRSEAFLSALGSLVGDEAVHPDLAAGASLMLEYLRSTANMEAARLSEVLGVERTRLYRGIALNFSPPPPCEAVWTTHAGDTTTVLQELAAIYRQYGLVPAAETKERPDYIGVELEYQRQMALNEKEAWQAGEGGKAKELLRQQADFLCEHTGRWVPEFVAKALSMAETDFYRGHLVMLRGYLADEQECIQALLERI